MHYLAQEDLVAHLQRKIAQLAAIVQSKQESLARYQTPSLSDAGKIDGAECMD